MSQEGIVIQAGLEIPPMERTVRKTKYPFDKMDVKESFFIADGKTQAMHACILRFCKTPNGAGKKFTVRSVTEDDVKGVRVWRTE